MTTKNKNSLRLTKDQMDRRFNDAIPKASLDLLNKHVHWFKVKPYCAICGQKVTDIEELERK